MKYIIKFDDVVVKWFNGSLSTRIFFNSVNSLVGLKKALKKISQSTGGLSYPPIVIVPEARVLWMDDGSSAIVFANLSIKRLNNIIAPVVEFTLPLLLYGNEKVYTVILSHEFLHYIYIAIKFYSNEYFINPLISTSTLSGRVFLEEVYQIDPDAIFKKGSILNAVKRFDDFIRKSRIGYRIKRNWIDRGLPTKLIHSTEFRVRLSIEDYSKMYLPDDILSKVRDLLDEKR